MIMSIEMKFFLYLIERYAARKNELTGEVLKKWDALGITSEIFEAYFEYHQESLENAFEDIDSLVKTGRHAW